MHLVAGLSTCRNLSLLWRPQRGRQPLATIKKKLSHAWFGHRSSAEVNIFVVEAFASFRKSYYRAFSHLNFECLTKALQILHTCLTDFSLFMPTIPLQGDEAVAGLIKAGIMKQWSQDGVLFCSYRKINVGKSDVAVSETKTSKAWGSFLSHESKGILPIRQSFMLGTPTRDT